MALKKKKITFFVDTFGPIITGVRFKIPKLMYVRANIMCSLWSPCFAGPAEVPGVHLGQCTEELLLQKGTSTLEVLAQAGAN